MSDLAAINLEDGERTTDSLMLGGGSENPDFEAVPQRVRSSSRSRAMDLNLMKSRIPGASQFFPAAALIIAILTLIVTIIINRATFNPKTCPKGPDFFVLATQANVSKSYCVQNKMCEYEVEHNLLPYRHTRQMVAFVALVEFLEMIREYRALCNSTQCQFLSQGL